MPETPDNIRLLEAALADARNACAELFSLMEAVLLKEPEALLEEDPYGPLIQAAMQKADANIENLRRFIEPWDERRADFPGELAGRVEHFLALLEKGLKGLQTQIAYRAEEVEKMREDIQDALRKLESRKTGFRGYKQKSDKSRLIDEKI